MENCLNGMKTQIRSFNNSRKAFRKKQCMGILNTRILNLLLWILTLVPPTRLQFFIRSRMVFLWVLPRNVTKLSILCPTQKRNDSHHHWIKEIQAHPKSQTLHHVHRQSVCPVPTLHEGISWDTCLKNICQGRLDTNVDALKNTRRKYGEEIDPNKYFHDVDGIHVISSNFKQHVAEEHLPCSHHT